MLSDYSGQRYLPGYHQTASLTSDYSRELATARHSTPTRGRRVSEPPKTWEAKHKHLTRADTDVPRPCDQVDLQSHDKVVELELEHYEPNDELRVAMPISVSHVNVSLPDQKPYEKVCVVHPQPKDRVQVTHPHPYSKLLIPDTIIVCPAQSESDSNVNDSVGASQPDGRVSLSIVQHKHYNRGCTAEHKPKGGSLPVVQQPKTKCKVSVTTSHKPFPNPSPKPLPKNRGTVADFKQKRKPSKSRYFLSHISPAIYTPDHISIIQAKNYFQNQDFLRC